MVMQEAAVTAKRKTLPSRLRLRLALIRREAIRRHAAAARKDMNPETLRMPQTAAHPVFSKNLFIAHRVRVMEMRLLFLMLFRVPYLGIMPLTCRVIHRVPWREIAPVIRRVLYREATPVMHRVPYREIMPLTCRVIRRVPWQEIKPVIRRVMPLTRAEVPVLGISSMSSINTVR
jgi:hypothetical protein